MWWVTRSQGESREPPLPGLRGFGTMPSFLTRLTQTLGQYRNHWVGYKDDCIAVFCYERNQDDAFVFGLFERVSGLSDEDLFLANWWNSHLRPKSLITSQLIRALWSNSDHLQRRPQSFVQAGHEALGELHLHPGTVQQITHISSHFKIHFLKFSVCGEDFWASQLDCVHWETLRLLLLCWQAGQWASGEGEHKSEDTSHKVTKTRRLRSISQAKH